MSLLQFDSYETPASGLPREQSGRFRIKDGRYVRGFYNFYGMHEGFIFYEPRKRLPITELQEKRGGRWRDWMVDDPPHWYSMQRYAEECYGEVLVGGLGLGLVVHALFANPRVTKITVVERSLEVMSLVWPSVKSACPDGIWLTLQNADFNDVIRSDIYYDSAVVDLWVANGVKEKERLFHSEVLPVWANMKVRNPEATLFFHGFAPCTDLSLLEGPRPITEYLPTAKALTEKEELLERVRRP